MKMRLTSILLFCLGLVVLTQAQVPMTGAGRGAPTPAGCNEATNAIARMTTPSAGVVTDTTTFICGGVTDGWWAKLDVADLFAADTSTNALLNLVQNAFNPTASGAPTFTAGHGFSVGSSVSAYINSNFNPSTAGGNYVQNSASYSGCVFNLSGLENTVIISDQNAGASNVSDLYPIFADNNNYTRINDATASGAAWVSGPSSTTGFWGANRSGVSASQAYLGGVLKGSPNATSGTIFNGSFLLGASTTVALGDDVVFSTFFAGSSLSGTDWTNLYSRLSTYMTARHGSSC